MDVRCAISLILLAGSCQLVAAQSVSTSNSEKQASRAAKILVLVDGRLVAGQLTPRPDGYDVQVAGGRMFINSDRVRFEAESLPDAYDHMRDSIPELTPANHLDLARWCLENKLHSQARREVLDALNLDPNREDAKRMLRALEHVGEKLPVSNTGSGLTEFPSLSEIPRPTVESRSLAGLSRSIAYSFTRDVQPLMMNKCATAGCHGIGAKTDFQITSTRRISTPAIAERNLAAILKQIDFSEPAASPLLRIGSEAHGNMAASAFPGRSGALQLQVLQDWVMQVSDDIAPKAAKVAETALPARGTAFMDTGIQQVSGVPQSPASKSTTRSIQGVSDNPHARNLTTDETDVKFLQDAKYANRHDAFSPDEFNRRYHGSATKSTAQEQDAPLQMTESQNNENIETQVFQKDL